MSVKIVATNPTRTNAVIRDMDHPLNRYFIDKTNPIVSRYLRAVIRFDLYQAFVESSICLARPQARGQPTHANDSWSVTCEQCDSRRMGALDFGRPLWPFSAGRHHTETNRQRHCPAPGTSIPNCRTYHTGSGLPGSMEVGSGPTKGQTSGGRSVRQVSRSCVDGPESTRCCPSRDRGADIRESQPCDHGRSYGARAHHSDA